MRCSLAEACGVPPSEISKWRAEDVLLMARFHKYRHEQSKNEGRVEVMSPEDMARDFGAEIHHG